MYAYGRDSMDRKSLRIGEWLGEQGGEGEPWYDLLMRVVFRVSKIRPILSFRELLMLFNSDQRK